MQRLTRLVLALLLLASAANPTALAEGKKCAQEAPVIKDGKLTMVCTRWVTDPNPRPGPNPKPEPVAPSPTSTTPALDGCAAYWEDPDFCDPDAEDGGPDVTVLAQRAALSLTVPAPELRIGPDPARNQWNMIPVGFPIWVWTTEANTLTATTTAEGITITMTATRGPTTITFGDGTTLVCRTMTPRPAYLDPPPPSPDCGHTYTATGQHTITATTTWTIQWQALGLTGTVPITRTAGTTLRVGELTAVLVPSR